MQEEYGGGGMSRERGGDRGRAVRQVREAKGGWGRRERYRHYKRGGRSREKGMGADKVASWRVGERTIETEQKGRGEQGTGGGR